MLRALIGRKHTVAAAERNNSHARPARELAGGQPSKHQADIHHLLHRADADHPKLLQDRVENTILPDQRAGMGARRTRARRGRAGLDHHDRLAPASRLGQRAGELGTVLHAFQIGGDHLRALVAGQRIEIIGERHHRFVAAADQVAETESGLLDKRKGRRADPPLCVTIEIGPARNAVNSCSTVAKVEVTGVAALMMPTQFGPHSLNPVS